ncbi:protein kinase [Myxococcota bacterium]
MTVAAKDRQKRQSHAPFGIPTLPRLDAVVDLEGILTPVPLEPEPLPPPPVEENIPHMPPIQRPVPSRDRLVANRYEILEQIGTGGMGRIFKVRHFELGKVFALKIIHAELSENQRARDMFYAEARLASSLEHRNIVSITDFGEDIRRGAFIVMEFLKGEGLADRLDKQRFLPVIESADIIAQTADAVAFIHGNGAIHGDLKPENIFLTSGLDGLRDRRRNHVKVLDFGLSRLKRAQPHRSDNLAGTPAYLAPERAVGVPPDEATDQYALGVLFYELLTGDVPFDGNVAQILNAHINTPPTPPSWRVPEGELDDRFDDLILRALAKDPQARFESVRSLLAELVNLMDHIGMSRRRKATPAPVRRPQPGDAACRAMMESNPLPMFAVDPDGRITMVNDSFSLFVKKPPAELEGFLLAETRLASFCPGLAEDLPLVIKNNKVTSRELEFSLGDKGTNKVLIWLAPLTVGGIIMGAHGVVHWIQK